MPTPTERVRGWWLAVGRASGAPHSRTATLCVNWLRNGFRGLLQAQAEARAATVEALDIDACTQRSMIIDDAFDHGQPDARAMRARRVKGVEHAFLCLVRNARTGVLDAEIDLLGVVCDLHRDLRSRWAGLHGVANEVP